MLRARPVLDVSGLPTYAFGPRSPIWWGTLGFIAAEGMGFVLAVGSYFYLAFVNQQWPLSVPPPNHWPGTIIALLLLASAVPNAWLDKRAKAHDLGACRIGLIVISLVAVVACGIRFFEFGMLYVRWDQNAYGSIVWTLLGLHFAHLVTDLGDTLVLTVLMFTRHAHGKRFSDVSDNCFYWYFVIASWLPIYFVLYWFPRL